MTALTSNLSTNQKLGLLTAGVVAVAVADSVINRKVRTKQLKSAGMY